MQSIALNRDYKHWDGRDSKSEAYSKIHNKTVYTLFHSCGNSKAFFPPCTVKSCLGLLFCSFIISTLWNQKNCTATLRGTTESTYSTCLNLLSVCVCVRVCVCVCQCLISTAFERQQHLFLCIWMSPRFQVGVTFQFYDTKLNKP